MKPTAPKEADIQRAVLAYLNIVGYAVKVPSGGAKRGDYFVRLCPQGTPDILGVVAGRMVAFEVKRKGGRLSPGQGETLDTIRKNGGVAAVVRSVADAEAVLKAEGLV